MKLSKYAKHDNIKHQTALLRSSAGKLARACLNEAGHATRINRAARPVKG